MRGFLKFLFYNNWRKIIFFGTLVTHPSLITNCTSGKRLVTSSDLDASTYRDMSQKQFSRKWLKHLTTSYSPKMPANQLYKGRGIKEIIETTKPNNFWIVSAGLGLVNSDTHVPGYDLTLSGFSESNIKKKINAFALTEWWEVIKRGHFSQRKMSDLLERSKTIVVALPSNYLELVANDLDQLSSRKGIKLRIIGRPNQKLSSNLKKHLIPFDDRIDGVDSPIRGTKSDFYQRAARLFVDRILSEKKTDSINTHVSAVEKLLHGWRTPALIQRQKLKDNEIILLIRQLLLDRSNESNRSGSAFLRIFRDRYQIACEQKRFISLYKKASVEENI